MIQKQNLKKIKLIVYDFDGVMTDNTAYLFENGMEAVQINRSDGLGIAILKKFDLKQIIISTEKNSVVLKRAEKLDIDCYHGIDDKVIALKNFCNENKIQLQEAIFIGNDINDENAMKLVGLPICPADAHKKIKKISKFVLNSCGGEGVIRELAELFLNSVKEG